MSAPRRNYTEAEVQAMSDEEFVQALRESMSAPREPDPYTTVVHLEPGTAIATFPTPTKTPSPDE